jgi:Rps23 Pro-64 3,4-dihydroxylase Tpa1-like proline 4-hydroxylase
LNDDWKDEYGGNLRLYPYLKNTKESVDISPLGNQLVLFFSDYMVHEGFSFSFLYKKVLPTTEALEISKKERYTITVWLKTENPRQIRNDRFLFREICLKHFQQ